MSYLNALAQLASPAGVPPPTRAALIGAAPQPLPPTNGLPEPAVAAQPHVEPPPYDVAKDAAWLRYLHPHDHPMRNFLNGLSPEERQMLHGFLQRIAKARDAGPPPLPGQVGAFGAPVQVPLETPPIQ